MIKFEQSDFKVKKETLPSKQERKDNKQKEDEAQINKEQLRILTTEFINDKIIPLNIPMYQIEEHIPILIKTLLNINKTMSTKFKAFLDAKSELENTNINEFERYDEKN